MSTKFQPHNYAIWVTQSTLYASDKQLLWMWSGTHWMPIEDNDGESSSYAWIVNTQLEFASPANAKVAHKSAILWAPALPPKRQDSLIIPMRNGYIHLENGLIALLPHDRGMGIRHLINASYDSGAPTPSLFQKFLNSILPDPHVQARVQEYIGYTLLPDARFQRSQIWRGPGANGKGVLANIVQALHARVAAVHLNDLKEFSLASMLAASLIFCDEAPQRGINEQLLKSLIAGESVLINRKYKDHITAKITGKWLILANHMPAITDQSIGFWRRFDIVPFNVIIPENERISGLADKIIAAELSGVVNWAIDGLLRLLKRGHFDSILPPEIAQAQRTARVETNSVEAWFEDKSIEIASNLNTLKSNAYAHYALWCKQNGMSALASPRFWNRLSDKTGFMIGRKRINGRQIPVCNLRLPDSESWSPPDEFISSVFGGSVQGYAGGVQGDISCPAL